MLFEKFLTMYLYCKFTDKLRVSACCKELPVTFSGFVLWNNIAVKPAQVLWNNTAVKPSQVLWNNTAVKPTQVLWNNTAVKPAQVLWNNTAVKPTQVLWNNIAVKPTQVLWNNIALKPAQVLWNNIAVKPAQVLWNNTAVKPAQVLWNNTAVKPAQVQVCPTHMNILLSTSPNPAPTIFTFIVLPFNMLMASLYCPNNYEQTLTGSHSVLICKSVTWTRYNMELSHQSTVIK